MRRNGSKALNKTALNYTVSKKKNKKQKTCRTKGIKNRIALNGQPRIHTAVKYLFASVRRTRSV